MVLPLLNSSFEPGRAREVVEGFVDVDLRNIARAELFYFTGRAEECCEITRGYLSSRVIELRLSACILYGYSNLTLGNVAAAKRGMEGIQSCLKLAMKKKVPADVYASCLLAGYVGAVLIVTEALFYEKKCLAKQLLVFIINTTNSQILLKNQAKRTSERVS